jgi:hypothetical protein
MLTAWKVLGRLHSDEIKQLGHDVSNHTPTLETKFTANSRL